MKKILLVAAIAGLAMSSCKKDRTCSCTSTYSIGSTSVSSNQDVTIVKESKRIAKLACAHTKSSNTQNGVTSTSETNCTLK